jgi:hypothetical protein
MERAEKLADEMLKAVNLDNAANKEGKPALKKFMLLDHVSSELRNLDI